MRSYINLKALFSVLTFTAVLSPCALSLAEVGNIDVQDKMSNVRPADMPRQFTSQSALASGRAIEITIVGSESGSKLAAEAMAASTSRVSALDSALFSTGGIEEQINSLPDGKDLTLTPDAFALVEKAVTLSGQTGGWYDVTAPSQSGTFANKDWRKVSLDRGSNSISFKSKDMKLDLRKIALGFYVDIAMDELVKHGITDAMVQLGPIQRTLGRDIYTPWSVAITFGDGESQYAARTLNYKVRSIATATVDSKDLARGFIDGLTKKEAVNTGIRSATIFASDAASAVAYALSTYANGKELAPKYLEHHGEIKGIFVFDGAGEVYSSPDFQLSSKGLEDNWPSDNSYGGPDDLRQKQSEEESYN